MCYACFTQMYEIGFVENKYLFSCSVIMCMTCSIAWFRMFILRKCYSYVRNLNVGKLFYLCKEFVQVVIHEAEHVSGSWK